MNNKQTNIKQIVYYANKALALNLISRPPHFFLFLFPSLKYSYFEPQKQHHHHQQQQQQPKRQIVVSFFVNLFLVFSLFSTTWSSSGTDTAVAAAAVALSLLLKKLRIFYCGLNHTHKHTVARSSMCGHLLSTKLFKNTLTVLDETIEMMAPYAHTRMQCFLTLF